MKSDAFKGESKFPWNTAPASRRNSNSTLIDQLKQQTNTLPSSPGFI
jgi:hypothetical protein